jgi:hypothetical protein
LLATLTTRGSTSWNDWMAATGYDAAAFPKIWARIKDKVERDPADSGKWRVKA